MQFNEVNWTPVFVALAIGAVAGIIMVVASLRRRGTLAVSNEAMERHDLEGERDAVLSQIQELDDTGIKASGVELEKIRYELELKLATVLRDLEQQTSAASRAVARQIEPENDFVEAPPDRLASIRAFLWGTAATASVAALVVFVLQTAEPKEQPMMANAGAMSAQQDAELAQIESAIQSDPENLDLQVELARAYLLRDRMDAVASITDAVLKESPDHPRALSYAALVQLQLGQNDRAVSMLKTALKKDPKLIEGWIHLALVYAQTGKMEEARAAIEAAKQQRPDQSAELTGLWSELQQHQAPDSSHSVQGTVEMKRGANSPSPDAAVFLIARDSSAPSGPPVAVKKLSAAKFPLAFRLDASDSMMGQPLPATMTIEARVDIDGNPMASNNEPSGRVENVALGSNGIQLFLQ